MVRIINIIILGLASMLTDISSEMAYPLIPLFLTGVLGASPAIVGIIEGIAESLASLLKVFSGYFSDRIARRKSLAVAGYSFSTLSKILLVPAASWVWVLFSRAGDRFGKGVRTAPRDALIADSSAPGQMGKAYGLHRTMDTFGASIGIIIAYLLVALYAGNDYRFIFLLSLIPAVAGVLVLFTVKEKKGKSGHGHKAVDLRWSRLDPRLKKFLIVVFLFALGNSSNQFLLLRAHGMGYSTAGVLLLYLAFNLVYTVFSYPAGVISDRVGRRGLLVLGYMFYGFVYLLFSFITNSALLWPAFALYGIYYGLTEGVEKALVAEIAPPDQRGTLLGLHATLVGIGLLPASLIAGLLWKAFGPRFTFLFGGFTGILAALAMAAVLKDFKKLDSPS